MALRLRDNLHWCNCSGRAVFLDLEADRYFCLPGAINDVFLHLVAGKQEIGQPIGLRKLMNSGILVGEWEENRFLLPVTIEAPNCDYDIEPPCRASLLQMACAIAAEARVTWLLRAGSFHQVIERASKQDPGRAHRRRRSSLNSEFRLRSIVAAAISCALVTGAHNRCLVRAIALHSRCKNSAIKTKLVFGVVGHPFAAHCWVQRGNCVLVGGFEQARLYTPILVVE